MPSARTTVSGALLDDEAVAAVRAASSQHAGAVSTLDILRALIEFDDRGGWSWVQLRTSYVSDDDQEPYQDPASNAAGRWERVPLTSSALDAFSHAERLAASYGMSPIPPGLLALGLVWNPQFAAARALLSDTDLTHEQLLHEIEDSVLQTTLDGMLDSVPSDTPVVGGGLPTKRSQDDNHRSSGWEDDWQLLETPGSRRFDYHNKVEALVSLILVCAFCLCLSTVLVSRYRVWAVLLIPVGLIVTFSVGPPRRSPLTSTVRVLVAAALSNWTLVAIALLLMASEAAEYYFFMPRSHAMGRGGSLLSAREVARLRVRGLNNIRRARARRVADLMSKGGLERALAGKHGLDERRSA